VARATYEKHRLTTSRCCSFAPSNAAHRGLAAGCFWCRAVAISTLSQLATATAVGHKGPSWRRSDARAGPKASLGPRVTTHLLFANCAPADVPTACKIAANDLAGAEVCAGLELPPGTDDFHN
jgi:hypothetical protein